MLLADEEARSEDLSKQLESVKAELKSEQCRTLGDAVSKLEETKSSLESALAQRAAEVDEMKTKLAEAPEDIAAKSAKLKEVEEIIAASVIEKLSGSRLASSPRCASLIASSSLVVPFLFIAYASIISVFLLRKSHEARKQLR